MKILVANIKGGMGKTVLSLNLALRYNFYVLTNDAHSRIDKIIGDKALILGDNDPIPQTQADVNVIYDMGGKVDTRLIDAAKIADVVLVPVILDTYFDLQATVATIASLEKYNKKILIVANKAGPDDHKKLAMAMKPHFDYSVQELKNSTAFKTAVHSKLSVREVITSKPWLGYHFSTPAKQLEHLMSHLEFLAGEVTA